MTGNPFVSARNEYHHARKSSARDNRGSFEQQQQQQDEEVCVIVEDRPYFPYWKADPKDTKNLAKIAATIMNWKVDCFDDIQVQFVPGGNTNRLYCISKPASAEEQPSSTPSKVLLRVFGGDLIDRDQETFTYSLLARKGIALPYHGRFANGRIEGWCDWRTLSDSDLQEEHISLAVASAMAELHHNMTIDDIMPEDSAQADDSARPLMWVQLEEWMEKVMKLPGSNKFQTTKDEERAEALNLSIWQEELDFLKTEVFPHCNPSGSTPASQPKTVATNSLETQETIAAPSRSPPRVCFCHNDILASNIMWDPDTGRLQLIDFEYGGLNYAGYDIANHFNEFAGGTDASATPNYEALPSPKLRKAFVKEYLRTIQSLQRQNTEGGDALKSEDQDQESVEQSVLELLHEISGFALANHLVWALWAVNSAATEGCQEFDYLHYAKCRMQQYFVRKTEWEEHRAANFNGSCSIM